MHIFIDIHIYIYGKIFHWSYCSHWVVSNDPAVPDSPFRVFFWQVHWWFRAHFWTLLMFYRLVGDSLIVSIISRAKVDRSPFIPWNSHRSTGPSGQCQGSYFAKPTFLCLVGQGLFGAIPWYLDCSSPMKVYEIGYIST